MHKTYFTFVDSPRICRITRNTIDSAPIYHAWIDGSWVEMPGLIDFHLGGDRSEMVPLTPSDALGRLTSAG